MPVVCCGLLLACLPLTAVGSSWNVSEADSSLRFTGQSQGEAFHGGFGQFDADIVFDPDQLDAARFDVRITLSSVDTQNEERDATLAESDFFDTATHPQARYIATSFVAGADGGFEAQGELDLRGVKQPVTLTFTWQSEADHATLEGKATLDRMAFGVGGGDWSDAETIAHEVSVETTLKLHRGGE
jgi:polyisoprenoid-binding protein YceI